MASKDVLTLQTKVREHLCDVLYDFETIHDLTGSMRQKAVIDRKIFSDYIPEDRLCQRKIIMAWDYFDKDCAVTFTMYEFDTNTGTWHPIKKVEKYSYNHKWPDTVELKDLLITFVAGGYDGQHFKDGVF